MKTVFDSSGNYIAHIDTDNQRVEDGILAQYDNTHTVHDGYLDDPERWHWTGSALVERADYAAVLAARAFKPVTIITVPVSSPVSTTITGSITVKNAAADTVLPVNKTYYVPLLNKVTNQMDQMISVTLVDGVGPISFEVANPGVYGIRTDLTLPVPTTAITGQTEIAIY